MSVRCPDLANLQPGALARLKIPDIDGRGVNVLAYLPRFCA